MLEVVGDFQTYGKKINDVEKFCNIYFSSELCDEIR